MATEGLIKENATDAAWHSTGKVHKVWTEDIIFIIPKIV